MHQCSLILKTWGKLIKDIRILSVLKIKQLWHLEYITIFFNWINPGNLSVMVLFPLDMTKRRRYSLCFPLRNLNYHFQKTRQGFEGFEALQHCSSDEGTCMLTIYYKEYCASKNLQLSKLHVTKSRIMKRLIIDTLKDLTSTLLVIKRLPVDSWKDLNWTLLVMKRLMADSWKDHSSTLLVMERLMVDPWKDRLDLTLLGVKSLMMEPWKNFARL